MARLRLLLELDGLLGDPKRNLRRIFNMWQSILLIVCVGVGACTSSSVQQFTPGNEDGALRSPASFVFRGARVWNVGLADVEVRAGVVTQLGKVVSDLPTVDVQGKWLVPGFIDSHVHLNLAPDIERIVAGGVVAAVDLAAPLAQMPASSEAFEVVATGPMITSERGYPTQSWGRDGYGVQCSDQECGRRQVESLRLAGARAIKVPIMGRRGISPDVLDAVVAASHEANLPVVAHALSEADLVRATQVDVFAHTPLSTISVDTMQLVSGKHVITTLAAFDPETAVVNLRLMIEAGAVPVYGTDLGNTQTPGISRREIQLMMEAGLSGDQIIRASTIVPAELWGMSSLGAIAPGKRASLLVLDVDPSVNPLALASPESVYLLGTWVNP